LPAKIRFSFDINVAASELPKKATDSAEESEPDKFFRIISHLFLDAKVGISDSKGVPFQNFFVPSQEYFAFFVLVPQDVARRAQKNSVQTE